MSADEVESQPTGRSGTKLLRDPVDNVSEGRLPTEENSPTDAQGDGEGPQSAGIPEAIMDLIDFAPEWESPGQLIGLQYQVIKQLGAGRCGVTYRVSDRELHREVALKRLRSPQEAAREGIQRFLLHAQAIATLDHPNIVKIHELGQDARGLFVVMEYLSGGDLHQKIEREGAMALDESLALIKAVGQGLAHAHQRGVVHCDIRPANIMLDGDGVPKLVDFGLAKISEDSAVSDSGRWGETAKYLAPEQLRDARHADRHSDLYALAKTFYYMVTGKIAVSVDLNVLPPEVRPAVRHALNPEPVDRPSTINEFLEELGSSRPPQGAGNVAEQSPQIGQCPSCDKVSPEDTRAEELNTLREESLRLIDPLVAKADELIEAGKLDAAGDMLKKALHLDPSRKDLAAKLQDVLRDSRRDDIGRSADAAREALEEGNYPLVHSVCKAALKKHKDAEEFIPLRHEADELAGKHRKRMVAAQELHDDGRLADALQAFEDMRRDNACDDHAVQQVTRCQDQINEITRHRDDICQHARDCEASGAIAGALVAWRQLADAAPDDTDAAENVKRLTELIQIMRRRRWRRAAVAAAVLLVVAAIAWAVRDNQAHLRKALALADEGLLDSARAEVEQYGGLSIGKGDVVRHIDNREADALARKVNAILSPSGLTLKDSPEALELLKASAALWPESNKVEQTRKALKSRWLGDIKNLLKLEMWDPARIHLTAAIEAFPRDERFRDIREPTLTVGPNVKMAFVIIWPGAFTMGSPKDSPFHQVDEPSRTVQIDRPFYLGRTEVTQAQYEALVKKGGNPSEFKGPERPVENVSWNDAVKFLEKLSAQTGKTVRLPDEVEWEYACRAGTSGPFWSEADLHEYANYADESCTAFGIEKDSTGDDGHDKTAPVASYGKCNPWGLHDMHGNVSEWCYIVQVGSEDDASRRRVRDPNLKGMVVLRGGAWSDLPNACRSARRRDRGLRNWGEREAGFRVLLELNTGPSR